jgi:signal transduction histidine kinase/CheY-like chemotaxis protein
MMATSVLLGHIWSQVSAALPRGRELPQRDWDRRNRGMLVVLWAHAVAIFLFVLIRDRDPIHALVEGGVIAIAGLAASWPGARRRVRAVCVCVGLLTASGILVHLSGGYIEMHFHFFVMVPLMALYEDWVPFLTAIAYVVIHHGTVGVLDASQVYNHPAAWASPWTWAAIHGVFVLGASVVSCISWRLNELAAADAAASAERFRNVVQNLDAVVWEADPAMTRFTFVSEQAERVFSIPAGRLEAERGLWERMIHPEDRQAALGGYAACVQGTGENQVAYRIVADGGRIVHLSDVVHVERDEQGAARRLLGVTVDTTSRRSLEDQLRQAQKMDALGRLAGGVAHDFNNLLTAILGYGTLMTHDMSDRHPWRERAEGIVAAATRASSLTKQLLTVSRSQVIEVQTVDLNKVVADMEKMLRRLIGEDIEIVTSYERSLSSVRVDVGQMEQILLNLAVNARDAMPAGGRMTIETANVRLDESYARRHVGVTPGQYTMLAVSDTGCGMSPETRAHIFEPFFTTKEVGKGTGLGLATVYGIVKQSAGAIGVYSELGRGTTFRIYLPAVDGPSPRLQTVPRAAELVRGSERILLVEDEGIVRELIAKTLTSCGYTVLAASEPHEAIGLVEEAPVDLILTDIVMPRMSGPELVAYLAPRQPEVKVLFMSGYAGSHVAHGGGLPDGSAFLSKPFTAETLTQKVREALDRAPAAALR